MSLLSDMADFVVPPQVKLVALGLGLAALVAASAFAGWTVNGWRLGAELASEKADRAREKATQAAQTVTDIKRDADQIHEAATAFLKSQQALGPKFDALAKEMKNAQPLPPDCRPDAFRVRNLESAIDAANAAAAAGHQPGNPLH
jgi:hypothetical protein